MLDRAAIAERIPHSGRMCLLERVVSWDPTSIRCAATSHRDPHNPMREPGGLPATAGIEYAAQAAAVHGALVQPLPEPRAGMLGALRDVSFNCEWLDHVEGDLVLAATLLHSDHAGAIYRFEASAGPGWLLRGRCTLIYVPQQ